MTRRAVLAAGGATLAAAGTMPGGMVTGSAWAATPEALRPETFATLVQMSRDIYPHDRLADKYYAVAVSALDKKAKDDPALRKLLEDGVAALDGPTPVVSVKTDKAAKNGGGYISIAWEGARLKRLLAIEGTPFFQTVRGHLVTALYNNKEVWAKFGYEGESASKGGYLNRGFDDASWIDKL